MEPIAECYELLRLECVNFKVVYLCKNGIDVVEGACHNIHPSDCVDHIHLMMRMLGLSSLSCSFILKFIPLEGFCSVGG